MWENMLPLRMLGPLVLMFLMSDEVSMCPAEDNPLLLDPPVINGQYGESVFINCTSMVQDHDGMHWRLGDADEEIEDEKSFVAAMVQLLDWNVKAECRIKLNSSLECSKSVDITVFKNPEILMFPTNHANTVVEGSLYEMQCDINAAPVQNLTVSWYKGNQTIMTQTFSNISKKPEDVSSTLTVSITREESGVQFRCEAQLDFGPNGKEPPVISEAKSVFVHYAPELKNQTDTEFVVNEGDNVTLNCEAEGNPILNFSWTRDGLNISENSSELIITPLNAHSVYTCTASNYLGNTTKQIHVYVIKTTMRAVPAATNSPAALEPKDCPLIVTPAKIVVRYGDPASVECSTSATDVIKMGWETTFGGFGMDNTTAVTWNVGKLEDWTIKPECFITLVDQQCTKFVDVSLYKTPDSVSVTVLNHSGPMVEGKQYQLDCDIVNVAPVQSLTVKWYRDNETVSVRSFNGTSVQPANQSVTLSVTAERAYNKALFRCETELHLGPDGPEVVPTVSSVPFEAAVLYKPLIQDCGSDHTHKEHSFRMDMLPCEVDGNPAPSLQWYYQGTPINASETLTRDQSGEYTVEAENDVGKSSISVNIKIEYGPSFSCDGNLTVKEGGELLTKCEPMGIPKPSLTWFKDGGKIKPPQHWAKHDRGKYLVEARNQHGTDTLMLFIDVQYAPVFEQDTHENLEVSEGDNVTLACSANGNPQPDVRWKYSSAGNEQITAGGRQKNITIRGATSTNAGVYYCVATNKVGNVTRSVTLVLKDKDTAPLHKNQTLFWLLIILMIIIVIIIISVIFCKSRKKHGEYSFVKPMDDIQMTNRA